jgi:hypothetical protein
LQHGDVITCGHHQLRFVDSLASDNDGDEFEKTMVIQPSAAIEERVRAANPPPPPSAPAPAPAHAAGPAPRGDGATAPPVALRKAKLQVLSGAFAGRELELVRTVTTLGRPGVQVAAITRRADGFFIVSLEAGPGGDYPLVNGTPIGQQARRLVDNDVITLAGVKMGFFSS